MRFRAQRAAVPQAQTAPRARLFRGRKRRRGERSRGTLSPPSAALCAAPPPEGAARGRRPAPPKPVQHAFGGRVRPSPAAEQGPSPHEIPRPAASERPPGIGPTPLSPGTTAGALFRGRERRRGRKAAGTLSPPSAALCAAPPPEGAARGRRPAPPKSARHALSGAAGALFRRRGRHRGRAIPQTRTAHRKARLFRKRGRHRRCAVPQARTLQNIKNRRDRNGHAGFSCLSNRFLFQRRLKQSLQ